ncbi:MAG: NAD-dependent epimerase/dehydratase family protein [Lachnospiraceae bacterium]|nr:NAD-dependent epimerase/dehydratase family protein [Lachnospiraceae bacterium]
MKKILVTGGTIFVSKYVAEYYVARGDEVYVLNRNRHSQSEGTILIEGDRHKLGTTLKKYEFDVVLDITSYTSEDIMLLVEALSNIRDYIFISSGAVYPETLQQPFQEYQQIGNNKYWGIYGSNKVKAERELLKKVPDAYILRPSYLYGPMNNLYREAFVFECARLNRKFYLPENADMKLQFFYVKDLCSCIDSILEKHPQTHIFNVGNEDLYTIREWVELCYMIMGKIPQFVEVSKDVDQSNYFSFNDYEHILDVSMQKEELIKDTFPFQEGLEKSYAWYKEHQGDVKRKGYIEFIDQMYGSNF